jgi:AraC-like DNA-binding protein
MKILATSPYRLKTLAVRQSLLVLVRSGEKRLVSPRLTLRCRPAQALLLAQGTQWEVVNDPAGSPRYEALCIAFDDEVLARAAQTLELQQLKQVQSAELLAAGDGELQEAIDRLDTERFGARVSPRLQAHRALELLLLLAERGWYFEHDKALAWSDRVRRLVAQRPDADWNVPRIAAAFHISPSSLRRRLEGEALTAAAIVREVRLETALCLLQGGCHSIGEVAQRCGWESHSRFTAAFHQRWGVLPSVVRANVHENGESLVANG